MKNPLDRFKLCHTIKYTVQWAILHFDWSTNEKTRNMRVSDSIKKDMIPYHRRLKNSIEEVKQYIAYMHRTGRITQQLHDSWISQLDSSDHENWYIALVTIKQHFKL